MANFTVSANGGFVDPSGHQWSMRGLNATPQEALDGFANVLKQYPGMTAIRLTASSGGPWNPADSAATIDQAIQAYTAKGIVVELEDHYYMDETNAAWYQQMAQTYKSNPLVFLETPNEPHAPKDQTVQNQIAVINTIRATGFANPIGLQPLLGWDTSNFASVVAAVGTTNIFATPHIYGGDWSQGPIDTAKSLGMFSVIDEFGDAMDGVHRDAAGAATISGVIAKNEAGTAGAVFWAMDNGNHADGADSAFLTRDGSQLTSVGKGLQPWLSHSQVTPPVVPPVTPPTAVTTGTGSDTLVLGMSEDAYNGDAQFTVSVDGKQLGGTFTTTALHTAGASQSFTFKGDWAVGAHAVAVNFLNDGYGGTATTDRNLYVNSVSYNGANTGQNAVLLGAGPANFNATDSTAVPTAPVPVTTGTGSDTLVLGMSEDAYGGDAQFTVSVDGKQLGGTFTTKALHATGASQSFTFKGDWAVGAHTVAVNFLNDGYGGTPDTDCNLYVNSVSYNGANTGQNAVLWLAGPTNFSATDATGIPSPATGSGNDTLAIRVSEDAYLGNAQFTVAVDGRQLGGTFTATALHATGASQAFTFKGDFGSGQHAVAVKFLNDAYGGTTATDRNLYVNGITYNGTNTAQSAALMSAGAKTFTVSGGTTPSVTETGDHGSLQKNLSQAGTYKVGGDTFVLSSGNAAAVTLGTGVSQIKFIGASSVALTGGSGQAVVTANAGSNRFVAGTGSLDVTGGGGKDAYVFHANSGMLTIQDFSLAKGDTLTVDKALQGSLKQASDGQGGTMLTFGTAGHGVDIHGIAALPSTNVLWA